MEINFAYRVFLRGVTWMRDSHGLFDYESRSINKKSLKTINQGKIIRHNNDIQFEALSKNEEEVGTDAQTLLLIKQESSKFYRLLNHCRLLLLGPF